MRIRLHGLTYGAIGLLAKNCSRCRSTIIARAPEIGTAVFQEIVPHPPRIQDGVHSTVTVVTLSASQSLSATRHETLDFGVKMSAWLMYGDNVSVQ
jgi:hypothetical protein